MIYEDGTENYQLVGDITFKGKVATIQIAPNPTDGNLFIDISKYMGKSVYYFVNAIDGAQILEGTYKPDHTDVVELGLKTTPNGIYILYLKPDGKRAISLKFVVAKDY